MKKLGFLLASLLLASTGWGQAKFNAFGPVNGVLKGSTTTWETTAAASPDIIDMWTGACNSTTFLNGVGQCATPAGTGGGTVNSVGVSVPAGFTAGGTNPVTGSGTIAITFATGETNHLVLGTGTAGQLGLIALTTADIPLIPLTSQVSGVLPAVNGGSGEAGTLTGILKGNGTSAHTVAASADVVGLFSGTCNSSTFLNGAGACATPAAGGTVTSVGLSWTGSGLTIGGTPVTTAGVLAISGTLNAASGGTGEAGTLTGILYGNATGAFSTAVAANVYGLFSGTCSSITFLRGDGACAAPAGVSAANPTATIGLTANDGSATTYMRSDASPALDQTISPVMTGNWEFIPSSGVGILIDETAGNPGIHVLGASGSGAYIDITDGGTGSRSWLNGVGISTIGIYEIYDLTAGISRFQIGTGGNVTIPTTTGGTALSLPIGSNIYGIDLSAASGQVAAIALRGNAATIGSSDFDLYQDGTSVGHLRMSGADSLSFDTSAVARMTISATGSVAIAAPSSTGNALTVTGLAGSTAEFIVGPNTASSSFGLTLTAGTNAVDAGIRVFGASGATEQFAVRGDGATLMGFGGGGDIFNNNGTITLGAPTTGSTLSVTQFSTTPGIVLTGGANPFMEVTDGNVLAVLQACSACSSTGGPSAEVGSQNNFPLQIRTNNATAVSIGADQGVTIGNPTGADRGAGTINVQNGIYLGGVALNTGAQNQVASVEGLCTSSGCTAVSPAGVSGTIGRSSTGEYSVSFSPIFSATPKCVVSANATLGFGIVNSVGTSSTVVQMFGAAGTATDMAFDLVCTS